MLGDSLPNVEPLPSFYARNWNWDNLDDDVTLIAPYFSDLFVSSALGFSSVSYQELIADESNTDIKEALTTINDDIMKRNPQFQANHAFILSFRNVLAFSDYSRFAFTEEVQQSIQLVLATDGIVTYGIFNYKNVKPDGQRQAISGFVEKGNCRSRTRINRAVQTSDLDRSSNIGTDGRFVILLSGVACEGNNKNIYIINCENSATTER